jgi:hypothetical protein
MRLLELERGRDIRTLIREEYDCNRSLEGTAKALGIHMQTLRGWIDDLGGEVRYTVEFPETEPEAVTA